MEEKLIFSKLEKFGINSHPYIMKLEHQEIAETRNKIISLLENINNKNFKNYSKKIISLIKTIVNKMTDNIFEENNIIYPLAIKYISNQDWKEIENKFNKK